MAAVTKQAKKREIAYRESRRCRGHLLLCSHLSASLSPCWRAQCD